MPQLVNALSSSPEGVPRQQGMEASLRLLAEDASAQILASTQTGLAELSLC
jgi:hypothetical protein